MTKPATPASPCTGLCTLDPARQRCLGCQRSLAEIAAWPEASATARQAILAAVAARQRVGLLAAQGPRSVHTERAYAADWAAFADWCAAAGQPALPAPPDAVAGHLTSLAGRLGPSGLRRRLAAIADRHRRAGQPWDPAQPLIRATLRDLLAGRAALARPTARLGQASLRALLVSCGDDLAGRRDRALFLLAQATALRRAGLVALDREQLRFTPAGMVLETARGGLEIARLPDSDRCPVRALEAWLRQARIDYGAVFRRVTAAGTLEDRLSPQGVWRILRRRAGLAKLSLPVGTRLSSQGLRAGAQAPVKPDPVRRRSRPGLP